jgi:hypothetical protein
MTDSMVAMGISIVITIGIACIIESIKKIQCHIAELKRLNTFYNYEWLPLDLGSVAHCTNPIDTPFNIKEDNTACTIPQQHSLLGKQTKE